MVRELESVSDNCLKSIDERDINTVTAGLEATGIHPNIEVTETSR